ncbi:TPA: hypothetical protein I9Y23_003338 [Kluyvera ascorbata]|uniref:Uncharacterized protein n=1 Tax=Kluyvera genomosp. 2 TaxID=2774054 RepID=A0A2T2XYX6_9ENTR|nr:MULTISPECIES: hypothetical protein [Enterobacteriaceae]HAT3919672.1 hypothetical protein [Kluyvera ascorbata]PSR45504.1 hypothetical protein C8256_17420 [Kluyvera genomosp. 2]BBQ84150.1 hypothetical protein WP3W18E02_26790 [Klebsiella sp. WP3-W18-ESBL-02]BBR21156.1 hypothetical protein WP3S18E05_26360 [Klebsiella sp. WP3-S18-ESBL-05]BBT71346.1 hypothetical protein WP8S18E06_26450 [Klebsiella sp. WP8-S18-ESBL-06]
MKTYGVLATGLGCLIIGGLAGYHFAGNSHDSAGEIPPSVPHQQEVKPQPKIEVYTYSIDSVSEQRLKNELKLKDQLKRGWIRFSMTIDRIQCETDVDCYAVSKEGGMGFSFRPHNTKSEDIQWLKDLDVGNAVDLVCSRYIDKGLYYDMRDCVPFDRLKPELINTHNIGE